MSELEGIKALAAGAAPGPWRMDPDSYHLSDANGEHVAFDLIDSETSAFVAEARTLVPQLVALIEKIRDDAQADAEAFRATSDRLWEQIRNRDPERNLEDAQRYTAYASAYWATARIIDKTIKEGLTQ